MKLYIYYFILSVLLLSSSCSNEEPYRMPLDEFPPIEIYIMISDEIGNDCLNPENPNNILEDEVSVRFKGYEYRLNEPYEVNPNSDESPVTFSGLKVRSIEGKYALVFGELNGSEYYKDEGLYINCCKKKGGKRFSVIQTISIYSIWTYNEDGLPDFYRTFQVSGEEVSKDTASPIINLVMREEKPLM